MKLNANEEIILARSMAGLLKQDKKSQTSTSALCRYRYGNSLKCAIGHCIDDEFYDEEFEGQTTGNLDVYNALIKSNSNLNPEITLSAVFLKKLQNSHDQADDQDFQQSFKLNLIYYGLVTE